eukprot:scaffold3190_cov409-Prasinococcus_capsulatus_cf.AAC.16
MLAAAASASALLLSPLRVHRVRVPCHVRSLLPAPAWPPSSRSAMAARDDGAPGRPAQPHLSIEGARRPRPAYIQAQAAVARRRWHKYVPSQSKRPCDSGAGQGRRGRLPCREPLRGGCATQSYAGVALTRARGRFATQLLVRQHSAGLTVFGNAHQPSTASSGSATVCNRASGPLRATGLRPCVCTLCERPWPGVRAPFPKLVAASRRRLVELLQLLHALQDHALGRFLNLPC